MGVTHYPAPRVNTRECSDFPPHAKMQHRATTRFTKELLYYSKMNLKVKQLINIFLSFFGLVILSPVFLIIAFLIKLDSEGPVFVRLKRISQGKYFDFYKFRSMVKDAHLLKADLAVFNNRKDTPFFKMKNDPRITLVGRFLRRYYLDELPSLINVLKGDINLVGPRPHEPEEVALYQNQYHEVVSAKAGITCLPRLFNPHLTFEEEMALEQEYLKNQSLLLDFKILTKTLLKILKDRPEG